MTRLLIDCDPGRDDAIALAIAAGAASVLGITTVGGNQTLDIVTTNAVDLSLVFGLDGVPVVPGAKGPLKQPLHTAASIHGDRLITGVQREQASFLGHRGATLLTDTTAAEFLVHEINKYAPTNPVTLVALGPLTNLALALQLDPTITTKVERVVIMGGSLTVGNVSATAEFNIATDPEAAHIAITAGWELTMVGLNVTNSATCPTTIDAKLSNQGTLAGGIVARIISDYRAACSTMNGFTNPPMHDPLALAAALCPEILTTVRCPLDVETVGTLTRGMTVADLRRTVAGDLSCPTQVATGVDVDCFLDFLVEAVGRLH